MLTDFTPQTFFDIITVTVFIAFLLRLMLAFGLAFLLPVILVGQNMVSIISGKQILRAWPITFFLVCLFAAMAAPGADALSRFYPATPMLLLFCVAIGVCLLNDKRRARKNAAYQAHLEATVTTASSIEGL